MGTTIKIHLFYSSISGKIMASTEIAPFLMERVSPRFTTSLSLIPRITVSRLLCSRVTSHVLTGKTDAPMVRWKTSYLNNNEIYFSILGS